jgi:hypothetical protein
VIDEEKAMRVFPFAITNRMNASSAGRGIAVSPQ